MSATPVEALHDDAAAKRALAYGCFAAICILWGTTFVGIRVAIETIPPLLVTGIRFTIAGLLFVIIALVRRERFPAEPREWLNHIVNGTILFAGGNTLVVWAEQYITSGLAALLAATIPLWTGLLESFAGTARFTTRKTIGLLVGFGGVALLVAPKLEKPSVNLTFFLAVAAMQLSAICWNVGSLRAKRVGTTAGPFATSALHTLSAGILVSLGGLAIGESSRATFTPRTLGAVIYLAIFGTIVAYTAFRYAMHHLAAGKVMLYAYVNPAVAVIVGAMMLAEPVTLRMLLAMIVILGGVAIAQSDRVSALQASREKT